MNYQSKTAQRAQRSKVAFRTNLAIVLVVALGIGAWIAHRLYSDATPKPQASTEVIGVADPKPVPLPPLPLATGSATGTSMADKENEEPSNPDEDQPLVLGKADPELDRIVTAEAKNYGEVQGTKKLPSPLKISATAARNPAEIAARIDAILDKKMAEAKVSASPQASDSEFLRRAYLDIVGVIPSAAKAKSFLASTDPDKGSNLIKELLADSDYGANFANYWHDLLVKRDIDNNKLIKTHDVFVKWLGHHFNANRPWNDIVHAMLTGSGDQALVGETFFVLANAENGQPAPNKIVGTASALFLGNQLMCCECHVHPMTPVWKQSDFWGLAAFFGKTRAVRPNEGKKNTNALARIIDNSVMPKNPKGKGMMTNAGTQADGSIAIPDPKNAGKYIGTAKASLLDDQPVSSDSVNRHVAADWFTSPTNPFFPRAAANRLWAMFFAHGLIDPLDDIRPDSVATHPEILELLAEEIVVSKFDQKHMIEIICRTRAYQRSSETSSGNKNDTELYSHMAMKVLTPRSLFRSYGIATANQVGLPEEPAIGTKPPVKVDNSNAGLAFFDAREYDENPGEYTYGVPQMLRLINTKLPPACDSVAKAAAKLGGKDKVIDHLYLTALSRHPTPAELKTMSDYVGKQSDLQKGYSDVMWVLLNSAEFINVH